ncbi:MAG: type II toxin-antitoxin system PemK/MazF family toxin [Gemmataceae bacterium]|nr:type II toxin-antitoxin system PemK/MazF family toxin [Gemmataceae bacterium]
MNHGDVHWVNLPDRGGHEQRGTRPAIIWQDTAAFSRLPTVLLVPLTGQLDAARLGASVLIQPSALNGLSSHRSLSFSSWALVTYDASGSD